jgi:hypothetical protein
MMMSDKTGQVGETNSYIVVSASGSSSSDKTTQFPKSPPGMDNSDGKGQKGGNQFIEAN